MPADSLPVYLFTCLRACLPEYVPTCLPAHPSPSDSVDMPTYLRAWLLAFFLLTCRYGILLISMLAYLLTYLFTCLPTYLLVPPSSYLPFAYLPTYICVSSRLIFFWGGDGGDF